jgi:hypothetical protein
MKRKLKGVFVMFRFREIREIKPDETNKQVNNQEEGFEQIKPETDMTVKEAKNFIDELFG